MASLLDLTKNLFSRRTQAVNPIVQRLQQNNYQPVRNFASNAAKGFAQTSGLSQYGQGLRGQIDTIKLLRSPQFQALPQPQRANQYLQSYNAAQKNLTAGKRGLQLSLVGSMAPGAKAAIGLSGALGGGFSALNKQNVAQGIGQGVGMGLQSNAISGLSNPILSKILPRGGGVIRNRIAPGVANVVQGLGVDWATKQQTTPLSVAIDLGVGVLGGKKQFDVSSLPRDVVSTAKPRQLTSLLPQAPTKNKPLGGMVAPAQSRLLKIEGGKQGRRPDGTYDFKVKVPEYINGKMQEVTARFRTDPANPNKLIRVGGNLENAYGATLGFEPEYDEDGKMVGVKFNPVAATGGVLAMGGIKAINGGGRQSANLEQGSIKQAVGNTPRITNQIESDFSPVSSTRTTELQTQQPQRTGIVTQRVSNPASESIIQQAKSEIGSLKDESRKPVSQVARDLYTQWVNRYAPIERLASTAKSALKKQGAELRPEADPTYALRRLTGAGGIADHRYQTELKPIIDQLDTLRIEKSDLDVYLKARRDIGLSQRNIKGSDAVIAQQRIQALEQKHPEIAQFSKQLYDYQNKGFQEMVDSGFLSPDAARIIRQENPDYVPFQRVMDEMDEYLGLPTRKTMQGSQPIQKIKGSDKQVYSPLESIIANTFKQRAAIEKNNVAKQIVGLQDVADLGITKAAKSGNDTITVWNNGQKEYYRVGEEVADTAKGLNEENMNTLLKIFQAPAALLRQGATGRNPDFMIPNVVRDQLDAAITSKYGYIPFVDYLSGLKSMLKNDDIYQKWQSSGAPIDLGELSGRKSIQQSFNEKATKRSLFRWLGGALATMGKYSEQPTRVGLFKKAYNKTGNELLAMMESRDATVDFARMGSKMRVANSVIPFLNVGVQGFDKLIRSVKDQPGKVAFNMSLYGALPAATLAVYNITNHPEEYAEIPQYEKDSNFVIVSGRNEDGTVDYITIPKGNILPVISNPIESFISFMAGQDQQSFGEFATQFISSTLPVVGDGSSLKEVGIKTIGSNLPQLIKPVTENLINKSFWKYDTKKEQSKEIVPSYLQKKAPGDQAYEWTPAAYKITGKFLNVSPLQVQNFMEGYFAGYAKIPVQVIESLKNISDGKPVDPNQKTILRRFIKQTYPTSETKKTSQEKETPLVAQADAAGPTEKKPTRVTGSRVEELENKYLVLDEDKRKEIKNTTDKSTLSDSDLVAYYVGNEITLPKTNKYEAEIRKSKILRKFDDIERSESITDQQKERLKEILIKKAGFTKEDFDYYSVAKQDTNEKTLYVLDKVQSTSDANLYQQLVDWRKPVNGKSILSDAVVDNLVYEGKISDDQGRALKKIDYDRDGKLKVPKPKKGKKPKKITIKVPKIKAIKIKTFKPIKVKKPKKIKFKKYKPKKIA